MDQGYREEEGLGPVAIELEKVYAVVVVGSVEARSIDADEQAKLDAAAAIQLEKVYAAEVKDLDEMRSIVANGQAKLDAVAAIQLEKVSSTVAGDLVVEQSIAEVEVEVVAIAEWHKVDLVRENEDHELGLVQLEESHNIEDPVASTEQQEQEEVLGTPQHDNLVAGSHTQPGAGTVAEEPIGVERCPQARPSRPPPSGALC